MVESSVTKFNNEAGDVVQTAEEKKATLEERVAYYREHREKNRQILRKYGFDYDKKDFGGGVFLHLGL